MGDGLVASVAVALAAGVAFIALFSFVVLPPNGPASSSTKFSSPPDIVIDDCIEAVSYQQFDVDDMTEPTRLIVHMTWNTLDLDADGVSEFRIMMTDKNRVPLQNVTYDFVYKGARDLGELQDRHVANFSDGPDSFSLQLNTPCDLHFIVFIDEAEGKSFLRTDPDEIEKHGNASTVFVEFRVAETSDGRFDVTVFP